MATEIANLAAFIAWIEELEPGQYLFRGVPNETYEIVSSTYLRLPQVNRNPAMLLRINEEYLRDARLRGHSLKDGQQLADLELLAELQHFGAATCLIDFTHSAQVALWFACEKDAEERTNGKVYAVRVDNPARFKQITPDLLKEELAYFFRANERLLYQWEPQPQNNRIIAQQSVFIFGGTEIEADAHCVIREDSKQNLLASLEKAIGITEARIFPDFDGFTRLRAYNKPYGPDSRRYLDRGLNAHKESKLDDAVDTYEDTTDPDNQNEAL